MYRSCFAISCWEAWVGKFSILDSLGYSGSYFVTCCCRVFFVFLLVAILILD